MGKLINSIAEIYKKQDETGVIMADTVLLACGCTPADIETFANHGIKEVPAVLEQRVKFDDLSDETLISNLFKLEQDDLDQLPISFLGEIAKSEALKNLSHDSQTTVFNKIFHTIGIESLQDLQNTEAEKVAYNHKEYKAIFDAFFSFNYKEQAKEVTQYFDQIVDQKLNEVLENAPELTNNPEKRNGFTQLNEKHNGNLMEASEEALSLFEDTKELKKENLQGLGLDKNFEQYSVNTAKAALAQYKLGAYAEAAKAKGLINEATAEKYSVVNPAEKENPVNKFVNATKNTMANFAKPQNLAKIGFRTVATKALQHVTEGAVPGIGAAVGLAMKLGECGKKIFKDKRKASEVFKEAAPDLVRGVVTVGTSFTPLAAIAGPIGTVASVVTRGIQGAHQEGLKVGKGFFKRILSEFKKKGNAINLASSVIGAGIGFASKEFMEHMNEGEEFESELINETQTAPEMEVTNGAGAGIDSANGVGAGNGIGAGVSVGNGVVNDDLQAGNGATGVTAQGAAVEPTLSYVEQYIKDHPGAHLDKNGWLQNADGSYARNDKGQLFGSEDRVFRDLRENEILDKYGNIVEKAAVQQIDEPEVKANFDGPEQQRPAVNEFKNERHAERFEEMQERDDRAIDRHNAKMDEMISEVDSKYIREQMEANEAKAMQDFENRLDDRYREIAADGEVTQREAMGLTKERNEFLREREQNLRNAIKANGYDTQPTKAAEVVKESVIKGYDDPTVAPTTQTVEETMSHEISSQEPTINQENVIQGYQDPTVAPATTEVEKAVEINEPAIEAQFATREAVENTTVKDVDIEAVENATVKDVEIEEQVKTEPLTVRSPEELAKIDELAKKAADARNFNSLPENQQRELIDIKAKAIVAQEQGDTETYQAYRKEFDSRFKDYVAEDKRLDEKNRTADTVFFSEEHQRKEALIETVTCEGIGYRGFGITEEQAQELLRKEFGGEVVNGEFVRDNGGSLKMEVPEVPDKNLPEQGYTQQADGTWLKENNFGSRVVTDVNQNGIPDAGDLFTEKMSFAGFSSETSGHIADYEQEEINPQHNAQTALDEAIARERTKLNIQQQDQGREL